LRDAAVIANAAAGVVVGKLGTASVTPEELSAAVGETRWDFAGCGMICAAEEKAAARKGGRRTSKGAGTKQKRRD